MKCREFLELADSYLGDELLVETNHDLLQHLESCAACRRELGARRALRDKLRAGFNNAPALQIRPEFTQQLRARLEAAANGRGPAQRAQRKFFRTITSPAPRNFWLATMAGLVLAVAGIFFWSRHNPGPPSPVAVTHQDATAQPPAMGTVMTELARAAAEDHQHCAVEYSLPEAPVSLAEAAEQHDPVYANLKEAVAANRLAPADFSLLEAHSCVFEGRRFGHLVMRYHGQLVSLLVTDTDDNRAAGLEATRPLTADNQTIACSQINGYRISCFATARHAVFVISDMSEGENLMLARSLAPGVAEQLRRAESKV